MCRAPAKDFAEALESKLHDVRFTNDVLMAIPAPVEVVV